MKRLFLTSQDLSAFPSFVGKDPRSVKVGFIPTAADPYEDKWFVDKDRTILKDQGFKLIEIDIKDKDRLKELRNVDVIYVSGGNAFYLLEKAIENNVVNLIKELVENGKLYAGASAGAVFAGPSIEPVAPLDDPQKAPNLKTYISLGLVNFIVLPHYGKEKYFDTYKKIVEKFSGGKYQLITLTDEQAVIVEDESYRIVESE